MGASPSKPGPASPEAKEAAAVASAAASSSSSCGGGGGGGGGDDNVAGGRRSKRSSTRRKTAQQQRQQQQEEEEEDRPPEETKNSKKKPPPPPPPPPVSTVTRSTRKPAAAATSTTTTNNDGEDEDEDKDKDRDDSFTFRDEGNRRKKKDILNSKPNKTKSTLSSPLDENDDEEEDVSAEEKESEEEEEEEEDKKEQPKEGRRSSPRNRSEAANDDDKNDDDNKSMSSSSTTISEASTSPTMSISKVDDFVEGSDYQIKDRVYATKGWYWSWGYVIGMQQVAGSSDPPKFTYDIEMLDEKRILKDVEEYNLISLDEAMFRMNELSQLPRDWPPVHFLCAHHGDIQTMEEKEETFKIGTKVYAEFNRSGLFWATISKVIPSESLNGRTQYRLKFDDGDQSLQDASMIHSLEESLRMMRLKQYEQDKPPKHWNIALDDYLNPEGQSEKKISARSTANRSYATASRASSATSNKMQRMRHTSNVVGPRSAPRPNELLRKRQPTNVAVARSTISTKDLKRKSPPPISRQPASQAKKRPKTSLKGNEVEKAIGIETTEEKEDYFDCGQVVYAEFPDNKQWYWGVISQKFPRDDSRGRRMEFLVVFCDGDRATLDCSRMTGYDETKHMMDNGFVFKNYPDPEWLKKQQLSSRKKGSAPAPGSSTDPIEL